MMQHYRTVRRRVEERDVLEVFSPAAPITRRDFFSGRTDQLEHLLDVVAQRGQHAVVYGERGVGKTSLVTVATSGLVDRRTITLRVNCDGSDDFISIWRKVVCEARLPRPLPPVVGLRPIQVPRMPPAELAAIARFALGKLEMTIADDAVARIVALSGGFPYYTHALGLLASREAVRAGESAVQVAHVERVAPRVID